ncbi:MAG: late competence development ComFB family protein [Bacillota bacterium]|nr:late competence development ComFB family protein [Bacillota bacterium]MDD3298627.1 late competence development ComFB family protein [Bacillota bacterium]MDD3851443.1 late competence development ComFB family protein [Bacillota bacterium]MDD4707639.1 late competence development ComFB family protein [Bacillota bacterium]
MKIKNYMEDVVIHLLFNIVKDMEDICKCEKCLSDIAAIALNRLTPHYVVSEKGEVYSKVLNMSIQFEADVTTTIMEAIDIVSKNPRH